MAEVTVRVPKALKRKMARKEGVELLEEMLAAFPKRRAPRKMDWDREYYSQFER